MDRAERRNRIEKILRSLTLLKGVTAASVVDPDGLPIANRNEFEIDTDALSASVQIVNTTVETISQQVGHGLPLLILTECKGGLIVVAPLGKGFLLTVIADSQALLGTVRYEIKESIPELVALI